MTVDVRAKVFCNLGTVIQASIADEALSARQGLIRCRGQVVLQGLQTPAVGSFVYFGWQRGNTIARIPRTLRVLSSFADPFRNQTTVQLGDKLVYLANLKNAKADPAEAEDKPDTPDKPPTPEPQDGPAPEDFPQSEFEFNEADSCYLPKPGQKPFLFGTPEAASKITALEPYLLEPASIKGKTALTISASSVLAKCLFALRIAQTGTTPIAQFTEDSFDLSSGYVNVIDQLLANESLYGYLNENEVLVVSFLDSVTGSGPLITSENLIDLNGLNQGILPGQQVTVSVKGTDLKPEVPPEPIPEPEPDPNEEPEADPGPNDNWDDGVKPPSLGGTKEADQLRNWEYEEVVGYNQEAIFYLEDGYQITYPYNTRTEIYTFYDDQDYVTKRITKNYTIAAADSAYIVQAKLQAEYDENNLSFFNPSGEINGFALKEIRSGTREEFTYREVQTEDQGIPEPELLCPAEEPRVIDDLPPTRVEKVPITQTVYTYQSSLSLLGQLNISGIDWAEYDITTLPNYDVLTEKVTVTYYQNQSSGQTKTRTDRFLIYGNTQQGQQDTAEKGKETTDAGDLDLLLQIASDLRLEDTSIAIQQDRTYGVQQRPSETDLAKEELQKEPASGSEKDTATNTQEVTLDQQSDTTESQPNLQVDMPFGSDDGFIWTASDGFEFSGGGASQLALRYARTQNAILRGNRNGVALQIPAYVMPLYPLSWVYLQAASVTGAYRSNGMSWAINSDGVLCSMDALFWGGVGGSGTPFFPVAPGITSLPAAPTVSTGSGTPANAITAPSGFNASSPGGIWSTLPAAQEPSYEQSIAPVALVPVVNEKVKLAASIKSVLVVNALDYPLLLPNGSATFITRPELSATKIEGLAVPLVVKVQVSEVVAQYPGQEPISRSAVLTTRLKNDALRYDGPLIAFGYQGNTSSNSVYLSLARVYANSVQNVSSALSAQPPSRMIDVAFNPEGTRLAYWVRNSPWLSYYKIENNVFTRQTPNAEQGTAYGQTVFSPNGQQLFVEDRFASPYYNIFNVTATGFTRIANALDVPPTGPIRGFAYSADDRYFAVTYSNIIRIYEKRGDQYVSKTSATLPASVSSSAGGLSWTPNNQYLAAGLSGSPFLVVYSFDGTSLTALTTGITAPGAVLAPSFSPDGKYLALAVNVSPRLMLFKRNGATFTQLTSGVPTTDGTVRAIAWSGYNDYFVVQIPFAGEIWKVNQATDTFTKVGGFFNLPNDTFETFGSLSVYPLPPLIKTPAQDGTSTLKVKLSVQAVSFDPVSPQAVQQVNAAPRLGAASATAAAGWTLIKDVNGDDEFTNVIQLPFNVTIGGVTTNQVYVESNSYLTFGVGSGAIPSSASTPNIEKLFVVPGDYSYQRVYVKTEIKYVLIRYEGYTDYRGTTAGNSDIIWEAAITEPDAGTGQQVIEVRIGNNLAITNGIRSIDKVEICNKTTALASVIGAVNTSYVITGNSGGSVWTINAGYSLTAI